MRLTADVVAAAPSRLGPTSDRELDLRGLKIPVIENLGVTLDAYDSIDFTDNEITRLENFPLLRRLRTLMLSNNLVARVEEGLGANLPHLDTLILTNNRLANLLDIDSLASCQSVTMLSLLGNPVTRKAHYRLFTVYRFRQLRLLDCQRVTRKERLEAEKLFRSKKGKAVLAEIDDSRKSREAGSAAAAAPGSGGQGSGGAAASSGKPALTAEQAAKLDAIIRSARTTEDVERLDKALASGKLGELLDAWEVQAEGGASSSSAAAASADSSGSGSGDSGGRRQGSTGTSRAGAWSGSAPASGGAGGGTAMQDEEAPPGT